MAILYVHSHINKGIVLHINSTAPPAC